MSEFSCVNAGALSYKACNKLVVAAKKILVLMFALSVLLLNFAPCAQAAGTSKKSKGDAELQYQTKDGFMINATLGFPKEKRDKYPLVVLLHSIGYSSAYWCSVKDDFKKAGFAVLAIDFRGHGKSIYTANFHKRTWMYLPNKSFEKYPSDVQGMIKYVADNNKNVSLKNIVIVGGDVGANTAIIAASQMKIKPKALVLLSPSVRFKGLYTPICLADLGAVPILTIVSAKDPYSKSQAYYLKRFAQGAFSVKVYPNGGAGMLMLKVNKSMSVDIVNWVVMRFNSMATPGSKAKPKAKPAKKK